MQIRNYDEETWQADHIVHPDCTDVSIDCSNGTFNDGMFSDEDV